MEEYLSLNNLSVGYNKKSVVSNIDIKINKGEIIALIGPNGAGKSTILKTISRSLDIIEGEIFLAGMEIRNYTYRELSTKMAVILTDRIKPELMTCRDIVATGRYPYTGRLGILSKEDEKKVYDALLAVNALDIADRDFNNISDGQRQRILLARAICQEPEIILLDEPTSYLDIRHKLELLSLLIKMARQKNITVITSLHEIDLAQKVADRIITVGGNSGTGFGKPGDIFEEKKIKELYNIDNGFYDPLFGSIEMKKPDGDEPEVFVIAGGGSGIPVYRELQKKNIPFATGVIAENDIDYVLARLLAARVISEEAFSNISDEKISEAKKVIDSCERVICAVQKTGDMNNRLSKLVEYAKKEGKLWQE